MNNKKEKNYSIRKTFGRTLKYIRKYAALVIFSFLCAAVSVVATLYAPILTGNAIDLIIEPGKGYFDDIKVIIKRRYYGEEKDKAFRKEKAKK